MRLDLAFAFARAQAEHDTACPEIGPICSVRPEPPQKHHTTLWLMDTRVIAEYGLISKLAVQAAIPLRTVVTRTRYTDLDDNEIELDYDEIHHEDETLVGLGDIQLMLHAATRLDPVSIGGRLGVSLPSGKVHEDPYRLGREGKSHQHLQFGTGTFDPLLGLDLGYGLGPVMLAAFGFAQVPLYEGPRGYRAGARVAGGLTVSHAIGGTGPSVRATGLLLREWAERWQGEVPTEEGNRGRTDLYVGPGVTLPLFGDFSASADVRFRVLTRDQGAQLRLPFLVELSIGNLFHLESGSHDDHVMAESGGDVADLIKAGEARALAPVPGKWTVFDFWADWCEACKDVDRELRELAGERTDFAVRRVNIVDFDSPIAKRELSGVSELPRVRLVDPSGKTVYEASGRTETLIDEVRRRLDAAPPARDEHGDHH